MTNNTSTTIAAIDLGTNSFHLLIATLDVQRQPNIIQRSRSRVQLGSGLLDDGNLSNAALARAIKCLKKFKKQLDKHGVNAVKAVGTSALRDAKNKAQFLQQAEIALGHPIEIISGTKEAELIYFGVLSSLNDDAKRLIIDIGGGSTELIAGFGETIHALTSLNVGCLRFKEQFFPAGQITPQAFEQAVYATHNAIDTSIKQFHGLSWQGAWGASGTIQSVIYVCKNLYPDQVINLATLEDLKQTILQCKHIDELTFKGLKPERRGLLPSGLAILMALFSRLQINELYAAKGALREGVLHSLAISI